MIIVLRSGGFDKLSHRLETTGAQSLFGNYMSSVTVWKLLELSQRLDTNVLIDSKGIVTV